MRFSGASGSGSVSGSSPLPSSAIVITSLSPVFSKLAVIFFAGSYSFPCSTVSHRGFPHRHGHSKPLILVEPGLSGKFLKEVAELLEFDEKSAAGAMTTSFVSLRTGATVADAVQALRNFDGDPEGVTEIYLLDEKQVLRGVISLSRLVIAQPGTRLSVLTEPRVLSSPADLHQNELAEMFDKYNLHALPVVDSHNRMVGVVHADHVISFLREKL